MPIRIVLFDDNKHIRESLKLLFETDRRFELVGSFEHAGQAEEIIQQLRPDVVLMDIDMPGTNGLDVVRELHSVFPDLPVMMLTVFDDSEVVFQALKNGALGYMLKSSPPASLTEAICVLHKGGAAMSPSIARNVMSSFQMWGENEKTDYHLSHREKEVLQLLVEGMSYKMIGARLEIGFETVRTHIKSIYEKLHVKTMTEAVAKSLREGLV